MFRIPGVTNNQPGGIMASGPNIMRASFPSNINNNRNQITSNFTIPANLYGGQTKKIVDRGEGAGGVDTSGEKTLEEKKRESLLEKFKREAEKKENIRIGSLMVDNPDSVTGFMS